MSNPLHKNQVGQPSTNGGHFAASTHSEPAASLTPDVVGADATHQFVAFEKDSGYTDDSMRFATEFAAREWIADTRQEQRDAFFEPRVYLVREER